MGPIERRQKLLEVLSMRRHDTYGNLAFEFNVSKMTIRHDIEYLSCSYPIETVHGGRYSGVKVADWFHYDKKVFTPKESALLRKLCSQLEGEDFDTMNSILRRFSL
ncbi:MAG: DeoR family transcriptional regulator [Oscillospiraceae bacterium]|nr:DeoR family transcriptional regulator [Oscillospiraceae bacterium]